MSTSNPTSRDRVLAALGHREPDRLPRDFGGTRMTSIHAHAYRRLRPALGLPEREPEVVDVNQGLARIDDDVLAALGADVRGISPRAPSGYRREIVEDGEYERFRDEWGVERTRPRDGGLYFEVTSAPLGGDIDAGALDAFPWPDPLDPARTEGMAEEAARVARDEGRAVYVGSICAGISEMHFRLRGYEDAYMDLAADQDLAERLMRRVLELKLAWWERVLGELGDVLDVAGEADDLGGQRSLLFSPETYRSIVKPMHAELFRYIHEHSRARVFFHSCGAIREIVPDLIEAGVDILNPVQVSAVGMGTAELKRDFGRELVFWGGAVDSQGVLTTGTPEQVRDEVRRRIEDLSPGGGYVFASVHNIQANVPTENIVALWETVKEFGDG